LIIPSYISVIKPICIYSVVYGINYKVVKMLCIEIMSDSEEDIVYEGTVQPYMFELNSGF